MSPNRRYRSADTADLSTLEAAATNERTPTATPPYSLAHRSGKLSTPAKLGDVGSTFAEAAATELDELMQQRGFSRGQVGLGADGSQSVLYCISVDALAARWPDVYAYFRRRMGVEVCADLTIGITRTKSWERADLEGLDLQEVVAALVGGTGHDLDITEVDEIGYYDGLVRVRRACGQLFPLEPF